MTTQALPNPSPGQTEDAHTSGAEYEANMRKLEALDEPNWVVAREHMDLTLLLARHANAEDARETLKHIEPGSVVFIEGYNDSEKSPAGKQYNRVFDMLNLLHATEGVTGENYTAIKVNLQDACSQALDTPGSGHQAALMHGLLERDCYFYPADYKSTFTATDSDLPRMLRQLFEVGGRDVDVADYAGKLAAKGKAYNALLDKTFGHVAAHDFREGYGLAIMMSQFASLVAELDNDPDSSRLPLTTKDGKIKTYLVYGTAHKHTLSDRLTNGGVSFDVIEATGSLPEHRYLRGMNDINSALAFDAMVFSGLMPGGKEDIIFRCLKKYDGLPPEEARKLTLSAIGYVLSEKKTVEEALDEVGRFNRTYLS